MWEVWQKFQLALSYDISNIGLVRVQYFNAILRDIPVSSLSLAEQSFLTTTLGVTSPVIAWGENTLGVGGRRIEAAFKLTAFDGITIDIGGKVPLRWRVGYGNGNLDVYYQEDYGVSLGVDAAFGGFGLWTRVDTAFGGHVGLKSGADYTYYQRSPVSVNFHIQPSYDLGFLVIGADFGLYAESDVWESKWKLQGNESTSAKVGGNARAGFGAWVKLPVGGGYLKAGGAYKLRDNEDPNRNAIFSIPIAFDYSF
jgi:hypothetical protein